MNEIYEILDLIKIRPAMYIGDHSITALYSFLNGYSMALKAVCRGSYRHLAAAAVLVFS